jgi:pimeloyl-ACP methyl ester carboxylesterase
MHSSWNSLWTQTIGEGPLVVWLHGLGESSLCFAAISRHRKLQGFRHRLIDLPGYGRSSWPAQAYSLEEGATELATLLGQETAPTILIGHSMGGVLAQLVAERAPGAVRAIINIDGNLSIGDCTFSGRAAALDLEYFEFSGFDELRDWVYRKGAGSTALRGYYASMRFADPRVFHRHSIDLLTYSKVEDFAARAAALPMPALFIAGVPDGVCAHSKGLLDSAGAVWRGVEQAGHWPFLDRPEDFATATADFLDVFR